MYRLSNGKKKRQIKPSIKYFLSALALVLVFSLSGEGAHVYVSVGSFLVEGTAEKYVEQLEKAGLKTFTELVTVGGKNFTRVTLLKDYGTPAKARKAFAALKKNKVIRESRLRRPWIRAGNPAAYSRGASLKTAPVVVRPDQYGEMEKVVDKGDSTGLKIVTVGQAGAMKVEDKYDHVPPGIIQSVPGNGDPVGPRGPILLFFNDRIYVPSLQGNLVVTQNEEPVPGTVTVLPNSNGLAILCFVPKKEFGGEQDVLVTVKEGIMDDGGNPMGDEWSLRTATGLSTKGDFLKNTGFEKEQEGIAFQGDGAVIEPPEEVKAPEGKNVAALSTGMFFSDNRALMDTTSILTCGPVNGRLKELTFKYNFASSEFNEYVGSLYDDSALLIVSGAEMGKVFMLESVNIAGYQTQMLSRDVFPGFPDGGPGNGIVGWKEFTVKGLDIKGPVTLTFVLSDVGDNIYSSLLFIDDIKLKMEGN